MKFSWTTPLIVLYVIGVYVTAVRSDDLTVSGDVLAEYDMGADGDDWRLPVSVCGKTYRFLVDSGTSRIIFDDSLSRFLGKPVDCAYEFETTAAGAMGQLFAMPEAFVGNLPVDRRFHAGCLDLSFINNGAREDVAGIIGSAFLGKYVVEFDFERARLRFLRRTSSVEGYELRLDDGKDLRPHLQCSINDKSRELFLIDTGSHAIFSVSIRHPVYSELETQASRLQSTVIEPPLVALGAEPKGSIKGDILEPCGVLRRFGAGKLEFARVRVSGSRHSTIGLRFLSQFIVTIDYRARRLFLKPIDDARGDELRLRILLRRCGGRTTINGIAPGNPGLSSGLREGDELVSVDGVDVRQMNIYATRRLLGRSVDGANLLVRHADGSEAAIRLTASSKLPAEPAHLVKP